MSKKKAKKKFVAIEVEFEQEDTMLPTKAVAIERRPYRNDRNSYNNREDSRPFNDRWRSNNNGSSQPSSKYGGSGGGLGGSFRNNNRERTNNYSNNNMDNNQNKTNESDKNSNWRGSNRKVQPIMNKNVTTSLNSNPSQRNDNAWRNRNSNSNSPDFRNRDNNRSPPSFRDNNNNNNSTNSSFRRYNSGGRMGGGGGGGGGPSSFASSKFAKKATSGGFGASVMSTMDNGKTRLTYTSGNTSQTGGRFKDLRNGNGNASGNGSGLNAPSKISSSRFKPMSNPIPNKTEKPKPFGSNRANIPRKSQSPPLSMKNNRNNNKTRNMNNNNSNNSNKNNDNNRKNQRNGNSNNNNSSNNSTKNSSKQNSKPPTPSAPNKQNAKKKNTNNSTANATPNANKKNNKNNKNKNNNMRNTIDKKLRKKLAQKWNKKHINGNKAIPMNADTDNLLICGLDQSGVLNEKNNYAKIAKVLSHLILDKSNKYTLNSIFDILFNKTKLTAPDSGVSSKKYLSLILELLSDIEEGSSCLTLLTMYVCDEIEEKYISKLPNLKKKATQKEFSEYGLEYIYPLNRKNNNNNMLVESDKWTDLTQILSDLRKFENDNKIIIYSNHKTTYNIISWVLDKYYFEKWSDDIEDVSDEKDENENGNGNSKNDNLAKELCGKLENGAFAEIVKLLVYKEDNDDEDDDEDDEYNDAQNSNYIVMLSCVISISCGYDCWKNGALLCLLKHMHNSNMFMTEHLLAFQQDSDEKFTKNRLNALSKLADWVAALDEMKARLDAERDNEKMLDSDEDQHANEYVGGSLLSKPKHKSAADYETISYVEIN